MGKVKKPRPSKVKKNVSADNPDEVLIDSKESTILQMLDQLQAVNVEEKYCGLQTFALLIETSENIPQLVQRGLITVVSPLLLDDSSTIRNAAAGVLRNFSAIGSEACVSLIAQDVITPLTCFFHEYAETWTPDPNSKTRDEDKDTFVQVVNLLWNLCESSEYATKSLCDSRVLDILPRYLDLSTFGTDIVTAVLQCLLVVVEDNKIAMEKIKSNSEKAMEQLLALEGSDPSVFLVRTLVAGVIINTCGGNITALPVNVITQIIKVLADSLGVDHRIACSQLSNGVPILNSAGKIDIPEGKAAQVLESQMKSVSQMLDAQQSSVEIVANICSCEDEEEIIDDDDSSDFSESAGDDDICRNGDDSLLVEDKLPPELLEALISLEVFNKVWARTQLPAENVMLVLREYEGAKAICKKLQNLQSGALLCVNNMLSSLPLDHLGGVDAVYKIWVDAGKLVFKTKSDSSDLIESATAVMRASLEKIKSRENTSCTPLFSELALTDIEMMITGIRECEVPEIRSNLIRMIGLLGLLFVNNLNETTSNVICVITEFLVEQAHKENEVWVLAEAIDTIVDLYSEDETDGLAAKVKLVEKLTVLAPILKNKAILQRRLPNEYKVLVTTVTSNLPRFIKYIRGRVNNLP